ncbi:M28 family peptidase [candidate division KSB1 bacterium]
MRFKSLLLFFVLMFFITGSVYGQITPWQPWTLLPEKMVDELIGEISGETTMNHAIEMGAYNHNRPASEYSGNFWETEYVYSKLVEYGLPGAQVVRFPGGSTWDGIRGELWEVTPNRRKLADYDDMTAMLASGSSNTNVTAELVWIGRGSPAEMEQADVEGKIVVTEGSISRAHSTACGQMGALGVIAISTSRPYLDPIQIPISGIGGRGRGGGASQAKFGFHMTARDGELLKNRLLGGERITVHALVESQTLDYEVQIPTCYVPGTDPNGDEIIFTAHLFEGYVKQGANDDISGCAVILEVARALNTLYNEGRLPRPKRTLRFIWAPEISGTRLWVNDNLNIMARTLCNINLDMVGSHLSKNFSFYCLMRTTFGNPHYINDVIENYMRYVGQTNREILQNRGFAKMLKPVVAPTGSIEPFYYSIETNYGSSDHTVFNAISVGVPAVMFITWPDQTYHTSSDRTSWMDATQLKRSGFLAAVSAYNVAMAEDDMAMTIAGEVTSNGTRRIGHQLARGVFELGNADAANFESTYRKVRGFIEAVAQSEKATIATTLELATNKSAAEDHVKELQRSIDNVKEGNLIAIDSQMKVFARKINVDPVELEMTDLEKEASKMIPVPNETLKSYGRNSLRDLGERAADFPTGGVNTSELNLLINGVNSALDIKKMLDVQYNRLSDLQGVMNHIEILKLLNMVEMK